MNIDSTQNVEEQTQDILRRIDRVNEESIVERKIEEYFNNIVSEWTTLDTQLQNKVMQLLAKCLGSLAFMAKEGTVNQLDEISDQEQFRSQIQYSIEFYVKILNGIFIKVQGSIEKIKKEIEDLPKGKLSSKDKKEKQEKQEKQKAKYIDILYKGIGIIKLFNLNFDLKAIYFPSSVDSTLINQLIRVAVIILKEKSDITDDDTVVNQIGHLFNQLSKDFGAQSYIADQLVVMYHNIDRHKSAKEYRSVNQSVIDICCIPAILNDNNRLVVAMVNVLATKYGNNEIPGVKVLEDFAQQVPKSVASNISIIINLLGHPTHQARQAVVGVLCELIVTNMGYTKNSTTENPNVNQNNNQITADDLLDGENNSDNENDDRENGNIDTTSLNDEERLQESIKKNQKSYLDIIIQRTQDKSAFVRKTVLDTLSTIIQNKKYVSSRYEEIILKKAIQKLKDDKQSVRVGALKLIRNVIDYSPFNPQKKISECKFLFMQSLQLLEESMKNLGAKKLQELQEAQEKEQQQRTQQEGAKQASDVPIVKQEDEGEQDQQQQARKSLQRIQSRRQHSTITAEISQINKGIQGLGLDGADEQSSGQNKLMEEARKAFNIPNNTPQKIYQQMSQDQNQSEENEMSGFLNRQFDEMAQNPEEIYRIVQLYRHWIELVKNIEQNMGIIKELLQSKEQMDIKECISIIQRCHYYELQGSSECMHYDLLPLIFNKDMPDIQKEVLNTFKLLYLGHDQTGQNPQIYLDTILTLLNNGSQGEIVSVREIFHQLLLDTSPDSQAHQDLIKPLIKRGWILLNDFHTNLSKQVVTSEDFMKAGSCLQLFDMVSVNQPEMVLVEFQYLHKLQMIAFHGEYYDSRIVQFTCDIIHNIRSYFNEKPNFKTNIEPILTSIVTILMMPATIIVDGNQTQPQDVNADQKREKYLSLNEWIPCAQAAIRSIFSLIGSSSIDLLSSILEDYYSKILGEEQRDKWNQLDLLSMQCQLYYLSGELSLKKLQNTEVQTIIIRKRRQKQIQISKGQGDKEAMQQEGNDTQFQQQDQELEILRQKCEEEILHKDSLLGDVSVLVREILLREDFCRKAHPMMVQCVVMCLLKFMICNKHYCETNLQLLFTVLQIQETSSALKCSIAIAIADLIQRWPNVLEPWVNLYYFKLLQQEDIDLKRNVLQTLAYVILNDMVKAKQGVAQIVVCLLDKDVNIQNQTETFFEEYQNKNLYNKQSPIYNLIPDILSTLWDYIDPTTNKLLDLRSFRKIIQFLLKFIQDDKQLLNIADRMCNRFKSVKGEHKYRCLAICLQSIKVDYKTAQKIIEGYKYYKNALMDYETLQYFSADAANQGIIQMCEDAVNKKIDNSKDKEAAKTIEITLLQNNLQDIKNFMETQLQEQQTNEQHMKDDEDNNNDNNNNDDQQDDQSSQQAEGEIQGEIQQQQQQEQQQQQSQQQLSQLKQPQQQQSQQQEEDDQASDEDDAMEVNQDENAEPQRSQELIVKEEPQWESPGNSSRRSSLRQQSSGSQSRGNQSSDNSDSLKGQKRSQQLQERNVLSPLNSNIKRHCK